MEICLINVLHIYLRMIINFLNILFMMLFSFLQVGLNHIQYDTLSQSLNHITDTLAVIVSNTSPHKVMDVEIELGNFWVAFISLFIGLLGVWFGWLAYRFAKKTADNVVRMTAENQLALFSDMVRHLYRNLVCTLAIVRIQTDLKSHDFYPSEDHFFKLKMLPEDTIHLDKYNDNKEIYRVMHELKLLLRNYDMEVDVCLIHYKDAKFTYDELIKDMSVLLFKPFYLMKRIADIEDRIYKYEKGKKSNIFKKILAGIQKDNIAYPDQVKNISEIIISEHLAKLTENLEKKNFEKWCGNYKFIDYVREEELPLYDLARGFNVLKGSMRSDYKLSLNWFTSDSNNYMTDFDKKRFKKIEFANYPFLVEYVSAIRNDNGLYGFSELISYILSVDVAIEVNKIKSIKI